MGEHKSGVEGKRAPRTEAAGLYSGCVHPGPGAHPLSIRESSLLPSPEIERERETDEYTH